MSKTGWPTIIALALAVPLLAGCVSPGSTPAGTDGEAPPNPKKSLSYYAECRAEEARHGLGQDVPCNGTATRVTRRPLPAPVGWPCWSDGVAVESMFCENASSVEEQWGFAYNLSKFAGPYNRTGGVVMVETMGERRLYHWPVRDGSAGFVAFPPAPWGEEVFVEMYVYDSSHQVNGSRENAGLLSEATLSQGWSLLPKNQSEERWDFYLVQNLETSEETYHFPIGPSAMGFTEGFTGPDFGLWLDVTPLYSGRDRFQNPS